MEILRQKVNVELMGFAAWNSYVQRCKVTWGPRGRNHGRPTARERISNNDIWKELEPLYAKDDYLSLKMIPKWENVLTARIGSGTERFGFQAKFKKLNAEAATRRLRRRGAAAV